jgi:hypothetical protein
MSLEAPIVTWYNGEAYKTETDVTVPENTQEMSSWNAGIVDAGSASRSADLSDPDPEYYPCTFLVWNNRAGSSQVSSMQSVQISTLSLVRNPTTNEIDTNLSYKPEGPIAGPSSSYDKRGHVEVIFYDATQNNGQGDWGIYGQDGSWKSGEWATIEGGTKVDVPSASGVKNVISGAVNAGSINDRANYAKIKMRLVVNPDAQAGRVEWYTRISYNYDGVI